MERPPMRISGPVLDAPDVARLTRFYEDLLGWEVEDRAGPRPGHPPGDGWSRVRPADGSTKIEIQFEEHYIPPTWPGAPGAPGMQIHLDIWVEDVPEGVSWAIGCGATEAEHQPDDRDLNRLRVMLDPAGHPFCLWS
jgi:catechol 2,3-dioxygenase-like lactoylglutathione lyase family enzyme